MEINTQNYYEIGQIKSFDQEADDPSNQFYWYGKEAQPEELSVAKIYLPLIMHEKYVSFLLNEEQMVETPTFVEFIYSNSQREQVGFNARFVKFDDGQNFWQIKIRVFNLPTGATIDEIKVRNNDRVCFYDVFFSDPKTWSISHNSPICED